ncbi:hypothetical protein ACTXT7_009383 [Hymenolepis weldensis]
MRNQGSPSHRETHGRLVHTASQYVKNTESPRIDRNDERLRDDPLDVSCSSQVKT